MVPGQEQLPGAEAGHRIHGVQGGFPHGDARPLDHVLRGARWQRAAAGRPHCRAPPESGHLL
ncbi:hypothetical protein HaLaN_31491, partial [Haematococcus lacustris]